MRSVLATVILSIFASHSLAEVPEGFTSLFNGEDLTGWIVPEGDNGHWKVIDNTQLPGIPEKGRIHLQHHGGKDKNGNYGNACSLIQFRNVYLKEL